MCTEKSPTDDLELKITYVRLLLSVSKSKNQDSIKCSYKLYFVYMKFLLTLMHQSIPAVPTPPPPPPRATAGHFLMLPVPRVGHLRTSG